MAERAFAGGIQAPVFERQAPSLAQADRTADRPRGDTDRRYRRIAVGVALTDALAVDSALVLASFLRFGVFPGNTWSGLTLVGVAVAIVGVFAVFHLYELSRLSPQEEFRRIIAAISVATIARIFLLAVLNPGGVVIQKWAGLTLLLSFALVMGGRFTWHKYMGRLRKQELLSFRVLILGANEEAIRIADALGSKGSGFTPVGLLDVRRSDGRQGGLPVLGRIEDLHTAIEDGNVECVFVAPSALDPELSKRLVRQLRRQGVDVRFSANVMEVMASRLSVQAVGNLLSLSMRPVQLRGTKALAKRMFDLALGSVLVMLTLPVWLAAAVAIKVTTHGPVFFRQERVGRHAKPFTMIKFRTMEREAESMLSSLARQNQASGPLFKIREDPRITSAGRLLRRFSLDELPQLINVLRGEMSLVGPRPPLAREVAEYEDWHLDRLEVRPGITGLWQVGRSSNWSFEDYLRLDLFYIENWSITYDLFIMLKTLPAVMRSQSNF